MKKAYEYAANRLADPDYPRYNDETEIADAYEQGCKDATVRAVEFIYAQQLAVPNIEELINELRKYMEEQQ